MAVRAQDTVAGIIAVMAVAIAIEHEGVFGHFLFAGGGVDGVAVAFEADGLVFGTAVLCDVGGDEGPFFVIEFPFDGGAGGLEEVGLRRDQLVVDRMEGEERGKEVDNGERNTYISLT